MLPNVYQGKSPEIGNTYRVKTYQDIYITFGVIAVVMMLIVHKIIKKVKEK